MPAVSRRARSQRTTAAPPSAELTIRFWGVRGSIAAPGPATAGVGGNTSCVEISCGGDRVILDAGTGIRGLGETIVADAGGGPVTATLLFSHTHWDHIQGFPFFPPVFAAGANLEIYGTMHNGGLAAVLSRQMTEPHFPVPLDRLPATLRFHGVEPQQPFVAGASVGPGFVVRAAELHHPGGVFGYRIELGDTAVVYATDTEHPSDGSLDGALVDLARGADVLIYDAMYTPEQYLQGRRGWGHSTWAEGVRIANAAGVGRLVLFHHDPEHDDAAVAAIEAKAAALRPGTIAAREGLALRLPCRADRRRAA